MDLVLFLLIGLAAGWLAGQLVKRRGSGWVEDMIVGVIGALIGGFVFRLLGVSANGLLGITGLRHRGSRDPLVSAPRHSKSVSSSRRWRIGS